MKQSVITAFLLCSIVTTIFCSDTVPATPLPKITVNDQLRSWLTIMPSKAALKQELKLYVRYVAVPQLLMMSCLEKKNTHAAVLRWMATGIALYNAFSFFYDAYKGFIFNEIPIPQSLYFKDVIVKHLHSYQQRGGACGWYPIFNACAIQELIEHGKEVTAPAIEKIVKERWIPYVMEHHEALSKTINATSMFDTLNQPQQIELAEHIGLRNYFVLLVNQHGSVLFNGPARAVGDGELKEKTIYRFFDLKEAFAKLKKDTAIVKHILLSIPGTPTTHHAVLLTLIMKPNEKPLIIYMDSNNFPLDHFSLQYGVSFFVHQIINYIVAA